jgi:hypothetical protein
MWKMEIFGEVFWMEKNIKEKIMDYDPIRNVTLNLHV